MDEQILVTLTQRLEALELQNRHLKRAGAVVVAVAAALVLMGQTRPTGPLRITGLDLVDATGTTRATLTVSYPNNADHSGPDLSRGTPSFTLYNRDGSANAQIRADTDTESPSLSMWGYGSDATVSLSAFSTGASLLLTGAGGGANASPGAIVFAGQGGAGKVMLSDGSPLIVWQAP